MLGKSWHCCLTAMTELFMLASLGEKKKKKNICDIKQMLFSISKQNTVFSSSKAFNDYIHGTYISFLV